jgi:hypothetical protein
MSAFASMSMRLRNCRITASDEGFLNLLKTPPSMDEMRDFFNQGLNDLETHLAKQAFLIQRGPIKPHD